MTVAMLSPKFDRVVAYDGTAKHIITNYVIVTWTWYQSMYKTEHFWAEDTTYLRWCVNTNSFARRGLITNLVEVFTSWS